MKFLPHIEWPFGQFGNKSNEFSRIARAQRVQFKWTSSIYFELSWRPFNMYIIIERDTQILEPWNRDSNKNIDAIKRDIKRIEWFSVQFGYKLNTHYSMNKSNTRSIMHWMVYHMLIFEQPKFFPNIMGWVFFSDF